MNAKLELFSDDLFFAGGDFDRIHLVEKDAKPTPTGNLSGHDSYWLIQVRKGTPSHDAIEKFFIEKPYATNGDERL